MNNAQEPPETHEKGLTVEPVLIVLCPESLTKSGSGVFGGLVKDSAPTSVGALSCRGTITFMGFVFLMFSRVI